MNPVVCVNVAAIGTPLASSAPVVTRILYVELCVRGDAGVTVKVVFPALASGDADMSTQVAKLSAETWSEPLQVVLPTVVVIDPGVAASLKVMLMEVVVGTPVAPSAGEVDETEIGGCVVKPAGCV